ncbi:MAG: hypothetical protein QXS20_03780 [Candidatus Thorarchaeota archaeon]
MALRILILGINPFDSGKTTLALQLGSWLVSQGRSVNYFKPVSGHNYWYRHEHTVVCTNERALISADATAFSRAVGSDLPIVLMNPVHTLFVPARLDSRGQPPVSSLGFAGWDSFLVMQRFTNADGENLRSTVLVASHLIDNDTVMLSTDEAMALVGQATVMVVDRLDQFTEFEHHNLNRCVSSCYRRVESCSQIVLIESFNDSVWPWSELDRVDVVIAVGPGNLLEFDADKVKRAVDHLCRPESDIRAVTFPMMREMIRPMRNYRLVPRVGLSAGDLSHLMNRAELV